MRRIITLVAAIAATVIAVTPAYAGQLDRNDSPTSSLAGTVTHQDLRGEHAQEAARIAELPQDLRGEHARDAARGVSVANAKPPVYWSYDYQAPTPKPVAQVAAVDPDDDTPWGLIAGLAAACLLIGGLAATGTRRRVRAQA